MMSKKRPSPKPKTVISGSMERLIFRYAELLELRRAVRDAERWPGKGQSRSQSHFEERRASPADYIRK
jgi:hypothetical protein